LSALVLQGKVVTFDPATPVLEDAAVYVADGTIEAVAPRTSPAPAGFDDAPRIRTGGAIYPGLIDLHSHLLYNLRTLWLPPRDEPYGTRDEWPNAATYGHDISWPAKLLAKVAGEAVLVYAEVKAIVGGTTAIQGAPGTTKPYEGFLVRNVDNETFGTGRDAVSQSVITLTRDELEHRATLMSKGSVFVYHLAEGTNPKLLGEFRDVADAECLRPELIAIHATALGAGEFERWKPQAGSIVWSPFSNLWLYRATTDVVAAREHKIRICLGADWGPSGSKNVLGELKVADIWNRGHLDRAFSDLELCEMVTTNPGDALARTWGSRVGRIEQGRTADLLVVDSRLEDVYRNLIESIERDVRLVLVGGKARYGRNALMKAAGAESSEKLPQAGRGRSLSLTGSKTPVSWAQVVETLEAVRADPQGALKHHENQKAFGEEPLELVPDMPEGPPLRSIEDLGAGDIPPLDTLRHDAAFFRLLTRKRAPILDGLLDPLSGYYERA
jgi:5-methylthioadenosine/S-adenosylhomocysteine deaminase